MLPSLLRSQLASGSFASSAGTAQGQQVQWTSPSSQPCHCAMKPLCTLPSNLPFSLGSYKRLHSPGLYPTVFGLTAWLNRAVRHRGLWKCTRVKPWAFQSRPAC